MSNHGVDIEIAEMTPIVSSDDRDVKSVKKKKDDSGFRRKRCGIRVMLDVDGSGIGFLVLHLMSPMTVTRNGVTNAVIIFFIFMLLSVILLTAFDVWWWNEIRCTIVLYRVSLYFVRVCYIFDLLCDSMDHSSNKQNASGRYSSATVM